MSNNFILSIESSCDDSSIAITDIQTKALVFHRKISQELQHSVYGGVVPELASRLHAIALPNILKECQPYFKDLKAIAVTNEPGLSVTLMEGVMMAKALAISLKLPLLGIHHLKGHVYSLFIDEPEVLPLIVLLVSGGHTQIMQVNTFDDMSVIAASSDDSFGESFDKVAKMMGLPYPGGPVIEKLAKEGDPKRYKFTIPLQQKKIFAFSYSGIKNAVRLAVEAGSEADHADIAASFQEVASEHLIRKIKKYLVENPPKNFAIVGGASANLYLREKVEAMLAPYGAELHLAELKYCSDNAAMIGRVAVEMYDEGDFTDMAKLQASPRAPL